MALLLLEATPCSYMPVRHKVERGIKTARWRLCNASMAHLWRGRKATSETLHFQ